MYTPPASITNERTLASTQSNIFFHMVPGAVLRFDDSIVGGPKGVVSEFISKLKIIGQSYSADDTNYVVLHLFSRLLSYLCERWEKMGKSEF